MDLKEIQAPLKEQYRADADAARLTLSATASTTDANPAACSVDLGRAIYAAQAHAGVGGAGTAACSGDLLLGALAACAQLTCQMAATSAGIPFNEVRVTVEGDLDLRGTLGVSREAPVGFSAIRVRFEIDAPEATERQRRSLQRSTEAFCVVMQTLVKPPPIETSWT
jgi:uncharacterized OsmC-like protein